jgi:glycosyltransferase involved in cell wall biosynthesis
MAILPSLTVLGIHSPKNRHFVPHYTMMPKLYANTRIVPIESKSVMFLHQAVRELDFWNLDSDVFYTEDGIGYDTLMSGGNNFAYFSKFLRVYRIAHGLFEQDSFLDNSEWNPNKNHIVDIYKNLLISDMVLVSPVLADMLSKTLPRYFCKAIIRKIEDKYFVAPPPDLYKLDIPEEFPTKKFHKLRFLWNHRFVASKNYKDFFSAIEKALELEPSLDIEILVLSPNNEAEIKKCVPTVLHNKLDIKGFISDPEEYRKLVGTCNITLATSKIESFGISVFDAISQGVLLLNAECNKALTFLSSDMTFTNKDMPKAIVKVAKSKAFRQQIFQANQDALTNLMPIDTYRKRFKDRVKNLVNNRLDRVSGNSKLVPMALKALAKKPLTKKEVYSSINWMVSNTCTNMFWGDTYYALRANGVNTAIVKGIQYYYLGDILDTKAFQPQRKPQRVQLFK